MSKKRHGEKLLLVLGQRNGGWLDYLEGCGKVALAEALAAKWVQVDRAAEPRNDTKIIITAAGRKHQGKLQVALQLKARLQLEQQTKDLGPCCLCGSLAERRPNQVGWRFTVWRCSSLTCLLHRYAVHHELWEALGQRVQDLEKK